MRKLLAALGLLVLPFASAVDALSGEPLPVDEAFRLSVSKEGGGDLRASWEIAEGYYLYRDHIAARAADGADLPVETTRGGIKEDPTFGESEVLYGRAEARFEPSGSGPVEIVYQGCQEDGLCYAPQTRQVDPETLAISSIGPGAAVGGDIEWQTQIAAPAPSAGDRESKADSDIVLAPEEGLVQSLIGAGGAPLVFGAFVLFGLLLVFTPCVFPMYPILAGALAREGSGLTPRRGFLLSGAYVLGLSTAFAGLGAIAGWSGQNLQLVLQSPLTIGILALIFVLLALSMFGLFELQLPPALTTWVAQRTGGLGGSKGSAALLGFSSVLIVGPCVTAPLAGALLYIAQTGNIALGAGALFGLGLGKGLPLILLGTLGGRALPRAGAWMELVKAVFGFAFLGTAIWIATPLLPQSLDLALWAALLIGLASFALTSGAFPSSFLTASRTLGGLTAIYGVILMVGAASGGTDPLKPLAVFAGGEAPGAPGDKPEFDAVSSIADLERRLSDGTGDATMLYFTADWCVTCRSIDRSVFPDPTVQQSLEGLQLLKADVTDFDQQHAELMYQLQVVGPPTFLFFGADARETPSTRLVGGASATSLARSAELVRSSSEKEPAS